MNKPEIEKEAALHGMRLTVANDADEQAANLSRWNQRYDQMKPGRFHGVINELWLEHIQFYLESTSHTLRQSCVVWPQSFWFGLPRCDGEEGSIDGHRLHENAIAIQPGNKEFELITPDGYDIIGVAIDAETIEQYGETREIDNLTQKLTQKSALLVPLELKRQFWGFLDQTLKELAQNPVAAGYETAMRALSHDLIDGLIDLLVSVQPAPAPTTAHQNYVRIFERVQNYVFAHTQSAISVTDLCQQLYVSRRTLQNCFQELLGMTPLAYLKFIRLNAIRRELKNPDSVYHTVQDIAAAWGFWHMSQFAADYSRLFCEFPSDALRSRLR